MMGALGGHPLSSRRLGSAASWFLIALALTSGPVTAQEGAPPDETVATAGDTSLTDAERLLRLERTIERDRQRLAEAKEDLTGRQTLFDALARRIEQGEAERDQKLSQLDSLGGADASEEARQLAEEIAAGEELIAAARTQTELTFEAIQTLQGQIQGLETKVATQEKSRAALMGIVPEDLPESAGEAAEGSKPAETGAAPPQSVGLATAREPADGGIPAESADPRQPATTEQLEARQRAADAEQDAQRAESAVVDFVERKQALDRQIELEQELLTTAMETRSNLDAAMRTARENLERLIGEGAGRARLQEAQRTVEVIETLQQDNRQEVDSRRSYLDSLREQLDELQEEQWVVSQRAEQKRSEAEAARRKTEWLESPLHPANLWRWIRTRGPRMLLVVVVAWALLLLVRWSARSLARTVVGTTRDPRGRGANRADTLALSFRSSISLFIVVAAVLLVFQEAGVDIKTVLGGAAILGVALAFGAQNLMRDYFTGFMILLEDQYELGDLITIGDITGTVERVNMRTTVLRDIEGRVHFIPNGEIKSVTNRTYIWGRVVLELPISYKENVDRVMQVIQEVAEELHADPEMGDWVTDDPVVLGVDRFTESGPLIKFMVQTEPDKIFATRRELLRRVKNRFDEEGIEISVPYRKVLRSEGEV